MTGACTAPSEDSPDGRRRRLGVVGWPVAHSRSPAMHNAALAHVGLTDWRYQRLPIAPGVVEDTLRALGDAGFAGVNVTIPHKRAALAVATRATERARAIGAANTLVYGEDATIAADNTDAPALAEALARLPAPADRPRSALVLGAGGSARAAVWALRALGVGEVSIWNRTPARATQLAGELGGRAVSDPAAGADLLVNCTAVELHGGDPFTHLPVGAEDLAHFRALVDFAYLPGDTELVRAARARGLATVDGLTLLVAQGAIAFAQFTGRAAPLAVMHAAARARI